MTTAKPTTITIIGGRFKVRGGILPIVPGDQYLISGCPECGCSKSTILITFLQYGVLSNISWEICECQTCHNRLVVESEVYFGEGDDHEESGA